MVKSHARVWLPLFGKSFRMLAWRAFCLPVIALGLGACSSIFPSHYSPIPEGVYRNEDGTQSVSIMVHRIGFDVQTDEVYAGLRRIQRDHYTWQFHPEDHTIEILGPGNDVFYRNWILEHEWRLENEAIIATRADGSALTFTFDPEAPSPVWVGR